MPIMDKFLPKGVPPQGDGAFERFLTAAIATIITIMFSWRMLDNVSKPGLEGRETKEGKSERRRKMESMSPTLLYAAASASSLSSSPPSSSSQFQQQPTMTSTPRSLSQRVASLGNTSSRTSVSTGGVGYQLTTLKPIIRIPVELPLDGDEVENSEDSSNVLDSNENITSTRSLQTSTAAQQSLHSKNISYREIPGFPNDTDMHCYNDGHEFTDSSEEEDELAVKAIDNRRSGVLRSSGERGREGEVKNQSDLSTDETLLGGEQAGLALSTHTHNNKDDEGDTHVQLKHSRSVERAQDSTDLMNTPSSAKRRKIKDSAGTETEFPKTDYSKESGVKIVVSKPEDDSAEAVVDSSIDEISNVDGNSDLFLNLSASTDSSSSGSEGCGSYDVQGNSKSPNSRRRLQDESYMPYSPHDSDDQIRVLDFSNSEEEEEEDLQQKLDDFRSTFAHHERHASADFRHPPHEYYIDDFDDHGDDGIQPRELDSDEELFCCSVLEPIMEEDSDELTTSNSSSDSINNSNSTADGAQAAFLSRLNSKDAHREAEYDLAYEEKKRGITPESSYFKNFGRNTFKASDNIPAVQTFGSGGSFSSDSIHRDVTSGNVFSARTNTDPIATSLTNPNVGHSQFESPSSPPPPPRPPLPSHLTGHEFRDLLSHDNTPEAEALSPRLTTSAISGRAPVKPDYSNVGSVATTGDSAVFKFDTASLPVHSHLSDLCRDSLDDNSISQPGGISYSHTREEVKRGGDNVLNRSGNTDYFNRVRQHGSSVDGESSPSRSEELSGNAEIDQAWAERLYHWDTNTSPGIHGGIFKARPDDQVTDLDADDDEEYEHFSSDQNIESEHLISDSELTPNPDLQFSGEEATDLKTGVRFLNRGDSFISTFSTRVEVRDSDSESDTSSVQTVITRHSSGTNSTNNTPGPSSPVKGQGAQSPVTLRPNSGKTTRRPVSDGYAYTKAGKLDSEEEEEAAFFRDRFVSEGGGQGFGEDRNDEDDYYTNQGPDLKTYKSYAALDRRDLGSPVDPEFFYNRDSDIITVTTSDNSLDSTPVISPGLLSPPTLITSSPSNSSRISSHDLNIQTDETDSVRQPEQGKKEPVSNYDEDAEQEVDDSEIDEAFEPEEETPKVNLSQVKTFVHCSSGIRPTDFRFVYSQFSREDRDIDIDIMDRGEYYGSSRGSDELRPGSNYEEEETEEDDEEWEQNIVETFELPVSPEKQIIRTLQNVKALLDQKPLRGSYSGGASALIPREYDDDYDDEEMTSTCTTSIIDVTGHDVMGFLGDDDVRSGARAQRDALDTTDRRLKDKMGFQLDLGEFKMEEYNTDSGWPIVRYIEKERVYVDEQGEDENQNFGVDDDDLKYGDEDMEQALDEELENGDRFRKADVPEEEMESEEGYNYTEEEEENGEEGERTEEERTEEEETEEERTEEEETEEERTEEEETEKETDIDAEEEKDKMMEPESVSKTQRPEILSPQMRPELRRTLGSLRSESDESSGTPPPLPSTEPPVGLPRQPSLEYAPTPTRRKSGSFDYAQLESPLITLPPSPILQSTEAAKPEEMLPRMPQMRGVPMKIESFALIPKGEEMVFPDSPTKEVPAEDFPSRSGSGSEDFNDESQTSDTRGARSGDDFDDFLSGIPASSEQTEEGYEDFVRHISDRDTPPDTLEPSAPTPLPILSGNLASPYAKPEVFKFPKEPKENVSEGSIPTSSPSYESKKRPHEDDIYTEKESETPEGAKPSESIPTKPKLHRTSTTTDEPDVDRQKARRSSSYSIYDESGNPLNKSFEETSSFALERFDSEPGLQRSRSRDALSRSKTPDSLDSLSSESLGYDSPTKLYGSPRIGVSTQPSLDVVPETSPTVREAPRRSSGSVSDHQPPTPTPRTIKSFLPPASLHSPGSDVKWTKMIPGSAFKEEKLSPPTAHKNISPDEAALPFVDDAEAKVIPESIPTIQSIKPKETKSEVVTVLGSPKVVMPVLRSTDRREEKIEVEYSHFDVEKSSLPSMVTGPQIEIKSTDQQVVKPEKKEAEEDVEDEEEDEDEEESEYDEEEEESSEEEEEEEEEEKEEKGVEQEEVKKEEKDEKESKDKENPFKPEASLPVDMPQTKSSDRTTFHSVDSVDDVFPPESSSASARTSPMMSSDTASVTDAPTTPATTLARSMLSRSVPSSTSAIDTTPFRGTAWAHSQFIHSTPPKPKSMKDLRKKFKPYKSVLQQEPPQSPRAAPFVLPDTMITPSRSRIIYQRNKFLSEQNLQSDNYTSEFESYKESLLNMSRESKEKERRYTPKTSPSKMSRYNSQEQLARIESMIRMTRKSESSLHDKKHVDCLHDDCILSEKGRREILDKTLGIDNLNADLYRQLQRFGSETDPDVADIGDAYFPETTSDLFDLTFPFQDDRSRNLDRPASMSELRHASNYSTISGAGSPSFFETASLSGGGGGRGAGKGRFAGHKQYKKSKSLCTLETNLDDEVNFASSPSGDNLQRVPSAHELRISKSLQKLNVPNWYKQSSISKSGSCLLKYGSSSTVSSFQFSPSLISSPCTTPSSSTNVVIKTRVLPPSSSRNLRSPRYPASAPTTPSFGSLADNRDGATTPSVKLPSDKLRSMEKPKALMPIPIVPFDKIRAMFENKKTESPKSPTKSPQSPASPTSPTSPTSKEPPSFAHRPPNSLPTRPVNGREEFDDHYDDVVPKVIVSPTEPHVKSILKKPIQEPEKRYSDIQEAPEDDHREDSPSIIKPVPTRPSESVPTMAVSQAPSVSIPAPNKQPPLEKPIFTPSRQTAVVSPPSPVVVDSKPSKHESKVEQKENIQPTIRPKQESKPQSTKEEPKDIKSKSPEPKKEKPRGFNFFKSLRSSSGSSSEDMNSKFKGRKTPTTPTSPTSSQSPNTSYDSEDKFPASRATLPSPDKIPASPPKILVTPDETEPAVEVREPPVPRQPQAQPVEKKGSSVKLEEAPVMRPPAPRAEEKPSISPVIVDMKEEAKPHIVPSRVDHVQETNLDDSYDSYEAPPAKESQRVVEAPKSPPKKEPPKPEPEPEKKRWFPKPKGWKSNKSDTGKSSDRSSSRSSREDVSRDAPKKFEISEIDYEPRRLRSSRSSGLDDSFTSDLERSRDSSNFSSSRPFVQRPARDLGRDYSREFRPQDRKSSLDSERSFTKDLERVTDKNVPRDLDRGSGRVTGRDSADRPPPVDLDRRRPESRDRDLPPADFNRREPGRQTAPRSYDPRDNRDFPREDPRRASDRRDDRLRDNRQPPPIATSRRSERELSPRDENRPPPRDFDRDTRNRYDMDRDRRPGDDLDRSVTSRASSRDLDTSRDSYRRPYNDDVDRSRTSLTRDEPSEHQKPRSSGRWQPKARGQRTSSNQNLSEESPSRNDVDSNGTSAYKYRVPGSAFSAPRPNTQAGLNTPPMATRQEHKTSASETPKSVKETTV